MGDQQTNTETSNTIAPIPNKRDTKEIEKMIQRQRNCRDSNPQPQISYEEACERYKFYKSRTLKANLNDPDFEQNMSFREFFLGIKKRYDMQHRAQKFRMKQKQEIAQLKRAFQERTAEDEVSQDSTCTGHKREASPEIDYK